MPSLSRRLGAGVACWAGVFVVTATLLLIRPLNRVDEAWMLWVAHRVAHGDVLYRQVYDVTTPIAAWSTALGVAVLGTHLWVLRLLLAAVFATEAVAAMWVARACGVGRTGRWVLLVALIAVGSPLLAFMSLYTAIGNCAGLLALCGALWWFTNRTGPARVGRGALAATGVAVALAFWAKPNLGILFGAAAVVAVVAGRLGSERRRIVPDLGVLAAAFAAVGVVLSACIALTGAWSDFIDQVFLSKGAYVAVGFSYSTALHDRLDDVRRGGTHADLHGVVQALVVAAPLVIVPALALGWWRVRRAANVPAAALVAFALAATLGVYPRPGVNHFAAAMPVMLTGTVGLWALAPWPRAIARARRPLAISGAVVVAVMVVVTAGNAVQEFVDGGALRSGPFAPAPLRAAGERPVLRLGRELRRRTDGRVFFIRDDAGYFSLMTRTTNPLPFDIAERSDFGREGQRGVIDRLRRGEAHWVCLAPAIGARRSELVPRRLEQWVRRNFDLVAELPSCDLYRATAGSRTGPRA